MLIRDHWARDAAMIAPGRTEGRRNTTNPTHRLWSRSEKRWRHQVYKLGERSMNNWHRGNIMPDRWKSGSKHCCTKPSDWILEWSVKLAVEERRRCSSRTARLEPSLQTYQREEVVRVGCRMKGGKSSGITDVRTELFNHQKETTKVLLTKESGSTKNNKQRTPSLTYPFQRKETENCTKIEEQPSKVTLNVIQIRFKFWRTEEKHKKKMASNGWTASTVTS